MAIITTSTIECTVQDYIRTNFLFRQDVTIGKNESLLSGGIIDSTGILELIGFLESTYSLKFDDSELIAENFDSVSRIEAFITKKLQQQSGPINASA